MNYDNHNAFVKLCIHNTVMLSVKWLLKTTVLNRALLSVNSTRRKVFLNEEVFWNFFPKSKRPILEKNQLFGIVTNIPSHYVDWKQENITHNQRMTIMQWFWRYLFQRLSTSRWILIANFCTSNNGTYFYFHQNREDFQREKLKLKNILFQIERQKKMGTTYQPLDRLN